ncbi:MAG: DUF5668 domain-containing protein [Acidobacteria bacterium]|nr:DUF5668 domain-containing protein [Acidobacteriota bacterium]
MTDSTEQSYEATPPPPAPAPQPMQIAAHDPRHKSPFLASLLSMVPGLGQVYVGYYQRGFIHVLVVASLITLLASGPGALAPLAGIFLGFFWLYNIVDAGRRAALYNEALAGRTGIEPPQDFATPALGGSVVGGTVVALVGFVLLLNTRFGVSLDWLDEWWPMALIAFGAYLIYKARQDKAAAATPELDEE